MKESVRESEREREERERAVPLMSRELRLRTELEEADEPHNPALVLHVWRYALTPRFT